MVDLAIIGCSHSGGVYRSDTMTSGSLSSVTLEGSWPLALARRRPSERVSLRAQHGGDVLAIGLHVHSVIAEERPRTILVQLPQSTRLSFGIHSDLDCHYDIETVENLTQKTLLMKTGIGFLTLGNVDFDERHWYFQRRYDAIRRHRPQTRKADSLVFLRELRDLSSKSAYQLYQQAVSIKGWIDAAEKEGIEIVIMNWVEYDDRRFEAVPSFIRAGIEPYCVSGGQPFMAWLVEEMGEEWVVENVVDAPGQRHGHITAEAQAKVVDFLARDPRAAKLLHL